MRLSTTLGKKQGVIVKIATVIVDMQEDFFLHERLKANRDLLTKNINELASLTRSSNSLLIWVRQEYSPDLSDAPANVRENGIRIVISGTSGADFLKELEIHKEDATFVKKRYSAFFGTELHNFLSNKGIRNIVLAGVNSHACIRTSAVDAYQHDYEVVFALECIDSYDLEHHAISMSYMEGILGACKSNEQIKSMLQSASDRPGV